VYLDLEQYLAELELKVPSLASKIRDLNTLFPVITIFKCADGTVLVCSPDVNDIVNQFEVVVAPDNTEFRFYAESFGVKLYSDPPAFYISEPNKNGFGEVPLLNWEQLLVEYMISDYAIDKAKDYLDSRQPVNYV